MKVRVKTSFQDKYTGARHKKDSIFEATEERVKEILKKGDLVHPLREKEDEENLEKKEGDKTEVKPKRSRKTVKRKEKTENEKF